MIGNIKRALLIGLFFAVLPTTSYAEDVIKLDVDAAIERSIELNTSVYSLNSKISTLDDAIRKSKSGADLATLMLHNYKVYIDMYESGKFSKYTDMTTSKLNDAYGSLFIKQAAVLSRGVAGPSFYEDLLEEIEFIEYIYMFGSEKPELTDEKIYKDFKRTEVFATVTSEFEKEKLLGSIDNLKSNIGANISTLYKSVLDYKFNMDIQKSLLIYKKENLDVLKKNYDLGLVSRLSYEKEDVSYKKAQLEYENIVLGFTNLEAQLKNQLKIPFNDTITLVDDFTSRYNTDVSSVIVYKESAKDSNLALKNLKKELEIKERTLELFTKYIDNIYDQEYVDLNFESSQLEQSIKRDEYEIEINVDEALNDLFSKEIEILSVKNDSYISKVEFDDAINRDKLGLLSDSQLSGFKLDMQIKGLNVKIKEREYENSKYLFDRLIDYGVKY